MPKTKKDESPLSAEDNTSLNVNTNTKITELDLNPEYEIVHCRKDTVKKFDKDKWNVPKECWNCGLVTQSWVRKYWTYVVDCYTTAPAPILGGTNLCPDCADEYTPVSERAVTLDETNNIMLIYRHRKKIQPKADGSLLSEVSSENEALSDAKNN